METESLSLLIATTGGAVLSLVLAYVPKIKDGWETLDSTQKRLVLAILYACIGVGLYVPSCWGGPAVVACDTSSIWPVIGAFFAALVGSQGMYVFLPDETKMRMSSD